MGGDRGSSSNLMASDRVSSNKEKYVRELGCRHCTLTTHFEDECPFIYSECKKEKCNGIRKLLKSTTSANLGKKFLVCQYTKCKAFQWLEEAIEESIRSGTKPKQHVAEGCFECGELGHWQNQCQWMRMKCRVETCSGHRKLKTSGAKWSEGEKYLRCNRCTDFEWLKDAKKEAEKMKGRMPIQARITIEANLSDLCDEFETGCSFTRK